MSLFYILFMLRRRYGYAMPIYSTTPSSNELSSHPWSVRCSNVLLRDLPIYFSKACLVTTLRNGVLGTATWHSLPGLTGAQAIWRLEYYSLFFFFPALMERNVLLWILTFLEWCSNNKSYLWRRAPGGWTCDGFRLSEGLQNCAWCRS